MQLQGGLTLPVTVVATGNENLNLGGAANSIANLTVGGGATLTVTTAGTLSVGVLSGSGRLNGAVTVTGTLSAGTGGTGTLTTGALTLNAGTNLSFTLKAPPTTTSVTTTGQLTLAGILNITDGGGLAIGAYPVFAYATIAAGTTATLGSAPAGFSYGIRVAGGTVFLDVGRKPSAATIVNLAGEHDGTASRISWNAQESQNLGFRVWRDGGEGASLSAQG